MNMSIQGWAICVALTVLLLTPFIMQYRRDSSSH